MSVALTRLNRYPLPSPQDPQDWHAKYSVSLEIVRGRATERERLVDQGVFMIGSGADCDMVLGDGIFPAAYAYLYVSGSGVSVRYLGSGPELLVRGSAVSEYGGATIISGDLIEMGPLAFRLRIAAKSVGRSAPAVTPLRLYYGLSDCA